MILTQCRRPFGAVISMAAVLFALLQPALVSASSPDAVKPHAQSIDPNLAAVELFRARAVQLSKHSDPKIRRLASTLETVARIMSATTPAERKVAVASLPVRVVRVLLPNGNIQKQFIVRGKLTKVTEVVTVAAEDYSNSGSGPSAAPSDCYMEEPEPCLTEAEEEEWEIELAMAEAEANAVESDTAAEQSFMDAYCTTNPSAPQCSNSATPDGSGSAPACWNELQQATEDAVDAVVGVIGNQVAQSAAKQMGKKAAKAVILGARYTMWGAIVVGGFSLGFLGACVIDYYWDHVAVEAAGATTIAPMLKEYEMVRYR